MLPNTRHNIEDAFEVKMLFVNVEQLKHVLFFSRKFYRFHNGPKPLSKIMNESMANDPLAPLLADQHLYALDRRVNIILKEIRNCINNVDLEHKLSSNTLSFS